MDSLTHGLLGICLARISKLEDSTPYATATAIVAAELPDIDVAFRGFGENFYEVHHRGITHSLVAVPILSALSIALIYGFSRVFRRNQHFRFRYLYALAGVCVLSHLASDWGTSYGLRLLEPFSSRWFSLDLTLVLEPWITGALLIGLLLPRVAPIPRAASAVLALTLVAGIYGARAYYHHATRQQLEHRLYAGLPPLRVSAYPGFVSMIQWHGVVETANGTYSVDDDIREFPRPQPTPSIRSASQSAAARSFLFHAAYPVIATQGTDVRFYDARWLYPSFTSSRGVEVKLSESGEVIGSRIGVLPVPETRILR